LRNLVAILAPRSTAISICSLISTVGVRLQAVHRKGWFVLLLLLPGLAAAAILLVRPPPEPTYAGRSLDSWVATFGGPNDDPQSRKAITTIVTNCLPSLIRQLQYDPRSRATITAVAKFLPRSLLMNYPNLARFVYHDPKDAHAQAVFIALCIAGRAARAAVPDLRQIAIKTNCPAATRAMQALIMIDDDPAPTLAAIILNPHHPDRHKALTQAWVSPGAPSGVIELLIPAVTNSNERIACVAIDAIGELARLNLTTSAFTFIPGAERLVPTLQQATHDPRAPVSQAATDALKIVRTERLNHLPRI
jgi:hypothetical protein